jgi:hypothetical protein
MGAHDKLASWLHHPLFIDALAGWCNLRIAGMVCCGSGMGCVLVVLCCQTCSLTSRQAAGGCCWQLQGVMAGG